MNDRLESLPPARGESILPQLRERLQNSGHCVVVLDDDPTGTQTVYDTPVLTTWSVDVLAEQLSRKDAMFYVLTNSRSLVESDAVDLARQIGRNLVEASRRTGRNIRVISRSDSTLRGHYPAEVDSIAAELGQADATQVIMPYFLQGGRLTIEDVHYVQEGDRLVPASETPFAKDATFGFAESNLIDWVIEKRGRFDSSTAISRDQIHSVSIADLRQGCLDQLGRRLAGLPKGSVVVVNAVTIEDARAFAYAAHVAEDSGATLIYRTAASFVQAYAGLDERPLLTADQMVLGQHDAGLIVVGSYVPKTTAQLNHLLSLDNAPHPVVLDVNALLDHRRSESIAQATEQVKLHLQESEDVVLFTSRDLVTGQDANSSLQIGTRVSSALVEVVAGLPSPLRFLIAKGGITSSDIATKALQADRAEVLGQILPGIPVWRLGDSSRRSGLPYVVFPGNVGGDEALGQAYLKLKK